jgi:hypothetical protein
MRRRDFIGGTASSSTGPSLQSAAVGKSEAVIFKSRHISFDYVVGADQDRGRDRQTERFRRSRIDHKLELGRLLDRQVCGMGAIQDLVDVSARGLG